MWSGQYRLFKSTIGFNISWDLVTVYPKKKMRFSNQWPLIIPPKQKNRLPLTAGATYISSWWPTRDIPKHLSCYAIADHESRRERHHTICFMAWIAWSRWGMDMRHWIGLDWNIEYRRNHRHIIKTKSKKKDM